MQLWCCSENQHSGDCSSLSAAGLQLVKIVHNWGDNAVVIQSVCIIRH